MFRLILAFLLVVAIGCGGDAITNPASDLGMSSLWDASTPPSDDLPAALDRAMLDDGNVLDAAAPLDLPDPGDAACAPGTLRCGTECVDVATSARHCGTCGQDCGRLPGVRSDATRCVGGSCSVLGACQIGRGDCDGNSSNGCETDLTTPTNCGACQRSCADPTPLCAMMTTEDGGTPSFSCASGCTSMTPARCGNTCVDLSTSVRHCGACGTECTTPMNGDVACVGGACRVSCVAGFHACGLSCASNTSLESCGTMCTPCPAPPPNATATCESGMCGFRCAEGFHRCGERCVSNRSTASCGMSCSACDEPAGSVATCDGQLCDFTCLTGYHRCGETCRANNSIASCGSSCSPCTTPSNSTATCDGTSCGFSCASGFHRCDDACRSNTSPDSCGSSCTPCPAPENGVATCSAGTCGFACNAGYHRCGDRCLSNSSPASCGSRCDPCFAPTGGVATCNGSVCGFTCNSPFTACGGVCLDTRTDVNNCGACGRRCLSINTTASCVDGQCTRSACNSGYADCNGDASDGCETNLWTDTSCGGCGLACGGGQSCVRGSCVATSSVCGSSRFFTVTCPAVFIACMVNSTCSSDSRDCYCNPGYRKVGCNGVPCTSNCGGVNFWCQPVP